jgi:hypothetical protein
MNKYKVGDLFYWCGDKDKLCIIVKITNKVDSIYFRYKKLWDKQQESIFALGYAPYCTYMASKVIGNTKLNKLAKLFYL